MEGKDFEEKVENITNIWKIYDEINKNTHPEPPGPRDRGPRAPGPNKGALDAYFDEF